LLGLIVLPKEKAITYLPKEFWGKDLKAKMGIEQSTFSYDINNLRDLVVALRHTVAHFDFSFESENEEFLIDRIVFKDSKKGSDYVVASFVPTELLSFIRFYGYWLVETIRKHQYKL